MFIILINMTKKQFLSGTRFKFNCFEQVFVFDEVNKCINFAQGQNKHCWFCDVSITGMHFFKVEFSELVTIRVRSFKYADLILY